ncbi:unnamed protein product [Rhizophagus irregularis]|uniref:Uncharacterized protein n=1 Tax=Rhizophagus irregularis TaxID=588596 RepID=A0A2I1G8H4_9GLOM|nr:hypothetical protein RhiirA4_456844 [Rhizophagus irregularis]CAB4409937.1 unnamed protein product [Rhizophagus irregularis]
MSRKGEENEGDIRARGIIIDPFLPVPSVPSHSPEIPIPSVIPTSASPFITTTPFIAPSPITSTEIVTKTENNPSLPALSTVTPRRAATHTSTITKNTQRNTSTINIAAIILGIMIGLVIVGGSIVILIQRKFSKNKEDKKNQSQCPSIDENVHNEVPAIELSERIPVDSHQRDSLIYFRPQFPLPPPRHPPPQSPLPQHPPQSPSTALYMSSSTYNTRHYSYEPPLSEHSAAIPNYYQKYSHLPLPTDTDVISPDSEESQNK